MLDVSFLIGRECSLLWGPFWGLVENIYWGGGKGMGGKVKEVD